MLRECKMEQNRRTVSSEVKTSLRILHSSTKKITTIHQYARCVGMFQEGTTESIQLRFYTDSTHRYLSRVFNFGAILCIIQLNQKHRAKIKGQQFTEQKMTTYNALCVCIIYSYILCRPGSSVGIATELPGWTIRDRIPVRTRFFRPFKPALWPTQPPVK